MIMIDKEQAMELFSMYNREQKSFWANPEKPIINFSIHRSIDVHDLQSHWSLKLMSKETIASSDMEASRNILLRFFNFCWIWNGLVNWCSTFFVEMILGWSPIFY